MERELLHTRQIKVEAFAIGENKLLLVGRLEDTRPTAFRPVYGPDFPAGPMHDMTLELEVSLPDFTITAARAVMAQVPREACHEVIPGMQALVGLRLAGGFTLDVKRQLGGPRGCAHFVSLVLAMAPMALQGVAAYLQQQPLAERAAVAGGHVIDSCYVWRQDGPLAKRVEEEVGLEP